MKIIFENEFMYLHVIEGVDTCRDRALNASGRGYYGQAKAARAAKATHGTQVPL